MEASPQNTHTAYHGCCRCAGCDGCLSFCPRRCCLLRSSRQVSPCSLSPGASSSPCTTVPGGTGTDAVPSPAVCMYIEESSLGRDHWRQNLAPLLQCLAATLRRVLQSQPAPSGTWGYLAVKVRAMSGGEGVVREVRVCVFFRDKGCLRPSLQTLSFLVLQACLQLFQALPKDVAPLAWNAATKSETLQSILGLLLEVVAGKVCVSLVALGDSAVPLWFFPCTCP